MLNALFNKVLNEYNVCRNTQSLAGNPLSRVLRKDIVEEIYSYNFINKDIHLIKGSAGQGNWTAVPWISIFDRRITTTAKKGVYIVYLFSDDGERLYLTLNQGCTELLEIYGKKKAIYLLEQKAIEIWKFLSIPAGFIAGNDLKLGNVYYENGCIFYKEYEKGNLPQDETLANDLLILVSKYSQYSELIKNKKSDCSYIPQEKHINTLNFGVEKGSSVVMDDNKVNTDEFAKFADWLSSKNYSSFMISRIIEAIKMVDEYMESKLRYSKALSAITEPKEVLSVCEKLKAELSFRFMNVIKRNLYVQSLLLYADYLKAINEEMVCLPQKIKNHTEVLLSELFSEAKYNSFILALKNQGIYKLEQLKGLNLFAFLNEKSIASGHERYDLLEDISAKLKEVFPDENIEETKTFGEAEPVVSAPQVSGFDSNIVQQLEAYLKEQGLNAVSTGKIRNALGLGKRSGIGKLVYELPWCVEIENGKFIHRDNIIDLDEAAEIILQALKRLFVQDNGYTSSKQLFDAVRTNLDMFMFDNAFEGEEKIYLIAQHLFSKEKFKGNNFIFYGNFHIWEKEPGYPKNLTGILIKFAKENGGIVTKAMCEEYLKRIGTNIINVPATMHIGKDSIFWQIDGERYILSDMIGIDEYFVQSLRSSLNALLSENEYVIIRDIAEHWYDILPALPKNEKWTPLLLQEAIRNLKTGYKTIPAGSGQSIDTVHAAITKEDSDFNTFADVVWDFVNRTLGTPIKMETEQLRKQLVAAGMLKGNERIFTMHKALEDYRFIWLDENKTVHVTKG